MNSNLVCENCNKEYKRQYHYNKHMQKCQPSVSESSLQKMLATMHKLYTSTINNKKNTHQHCSSCKCYLKQVQQHDDNQVIKKQINTNIVPMNKIHFYDPYEKIFIIKDQVYNALHIPDDITYAYDYDIVYYDIEAYTQTKEMASVRNQNSNITIITALYKNQTYIFTLEVYVSQYKNTYNSIINTYCNEQSMCLGFLSWLSTIPSYVLCVGFNSSSQQQANMTRDEDYIKYLYKQPYLGYDLPFIFQRCYFSPEIKLK